MKTTRRKSILVLAALFACFALASCGSVDFDIDLVEEIEGEGEITVVDHSVEGSFTSVKICCHLEMDVDHDVDAPESIVITGNENLHEHLEVIVEDGVLAISSEDGKGLKAEEPIVVTISGYGIERLEVGENSTVSGAIENADAVTIGASDDAEAEIDVDTSLLTVEAEGGSSVIVSGRADSIDVDARIVSSIDLTATEVVDGKAAASGSSSIDMKASGNVDEDVADDSSININ